MVDAFVGTWKLVDTANFDEYMKALGEWQGGLRVGGADGVRASPPLLFYPPFAWPSPPPTPHTRGSGCRGVQAVEGSLLPGGGGLWGALGLSVWGLGLGKGVSSFPCPPPRSPRGGGRGRPRRGAGSPRDPSGLHPSPPSPPAPTPVQLLGRVGPPAKTSLVGGGGVCDTGVPPHPAQPRSWWVLVQDRSPSNSSVLSPPRFAPAPEPPQAWWAHTGPWNCRRGAVLGFAPPTSGGGRAPG